MPTGKMPCYGRIETAGSQAVGQDGSERELAMSLDRSLRQKNALIRHRNVLKRDERIVLLKEQEKWDEGRSLFGLPKVPHRKVATKKAPRSPPRPPRTEARSRPRCGSAAAPAAAAPAAKGAKACAAPAAKVLPPPPSGAPAGKADAKPAAKGKK